MTKQFKLAVLATAVGAVLTSVQAASYNGHLLIGFTSGSGSDLIYDLGAESSLTNNQTWNLSSLLSGYNLTSVNWGVIGDNNNQSGDGVDDRAWTTVPSPNPLYGDASWGSLNTVDKSIYQWMPAAGAGQHFSIAATDANSWNQQTINGSGFQQYVNVYANPNMVGLTSASLYQVIADGSDPTLVGSFTLAANGVVTFNTGSTPPVASFTGTPTNGFTPLQVAFADASTGSITNWLWNFGDGHSITNSAASNVTNTYAAAGSYTVTLTVNGPGGASTNMQTSYIVISPAPTIGNVNLVGGQLVFSGSNCPSGAQYRILTSTNLALPLASWQPVVTNTFPGNGSYYYTNSTTKSQGFFRLVSP